MNIEKLQQAYKEKKRVSLYHNNNYIGLINFENIKYCDIREYSLYIYENISSNGKYFLNLSMIINYDTFVINN